VPAFVVLSLLALGLGGVAWVGWRAITEASDRPPTFLPTGDAGSTASPSWNPAEPLTIESVRRGAHLIFQNVIRDDHYAATSLVPLARPGSMRVTTDLVCERVHFAAGRGICLTADHNETTRYFAVVFDDQFSRLSSLDLDGAPTFARVSPDGALAAASFQTSPPTAQMPFAPTETLIIDTSTGDVVADLSDFELIREGSPVSETEVDHWGVTFAPDGDLFYASVRFGGNTYLARGSIEARTLEVLDATVSAPALSPDGRRIAFAKLVSNLGPTWRFHVLDLESGVQTPLSEIASVDDQMEWMGNDRLLYGRATDIWNVAADGTGAPQPYLFGGLSPAVVQAAP
jgi:hypothetical protein